jgi:hypothetical protein
MYTQDLVPPHLTYAASPRHQGHGGMHHTWEALAGGSIARVPRVARTLVGPRARGVPIAPRGVAHCAA